MKKKTSKNRPGIAKSLRKISPALRQFSGKTRRQKINGCQMPELCFQAARWGDCLLSLIRTAVIRVSRRSGGPWRIVSTITDACIRADRFCSKLDLTKQFLVSFYASLKLECTSSVHQQYKYKVFDSLSANNNLMQRKI